MRNQKSVTPAVLAANRLNARKSTGPRRHNNVKHNAIKHGLLTKTFPFKNDEEEVEFRKFRHELRADLRPEGAVETILVEEIAVCWWKVRMATEWELGELTARRSGSKAVVEAYAESTQLWSNWQSHLQNAAKSGWELRELTLRVGGSDKGTLSKEAGIRHFEAKLGSAAESGMRYRNAWKRDLYKAMKALKTVQEERNGRRHE